MPGLTGLFTMGANAGLIASDASLDPFKGYNFLIQIDGLIVGGFQTISGIQGQIQVETYAEGGRNTYSHTFARNTTWPNLVLSRGLTEIDAMWNWYVATSRGVIRPRSGSILVLDDNQVPQTLWNFAKALPVRWEGPSLDSKNGNLLATETIELAHRGLEKPLWAQVAGTGMAATKLAGGY